MIAPILGGILLVMNRAVPVYTAVVVFAIAGFCVLLLKEDENSRREKGKVMLHWIDSYIVVQNKWTLLTLETARNLFIIGKGQYHVCCCASTSRNSEVLMFGVQSSPADPWSSVRDFAALFLGWRQIIDRLLWDSLNTCRNRPSMTCHWKHFLKRGLRTSIPRYRLAQHNEPNFLSDYCNDSTFHHTTILPIHHDTLPTPYSPSTRPPVDT